MRHDPFVYFDDVTDKNNISSAYCIEHVRPFEELAKDLANNSVAQYNLITPNVCDDMQTWQGTATSRVSPPRANRKVTLQRIGEIFGQIRVRALVVDIDRDLSEFGHGKQPASMSVDR